MIEEEQRQKITASVEGCRVTVPKQGRLLVATSKDAVFSVLVLLKADGFDHLALISCVDWMDEGELELSYHLWSYGKRIHTIVTARIARESPHFLSLIPLFPNAQTYEREIHEMFGVRFKGHPRLTPLLLDHWQGPPPMRKDFDLREYARETFGVQERAE